MEVKVKVTMGDLLSRFDPKTQVNMHRNIINRLARIAVQDTKKRISGRYNIGQRTIIIKQTNATTSNLTARLSARKKELSLARFNPMEAGSGAVASVTKGGTVFIEGAFVAQPVGHDWSNRGQKAQRTASLPLVFKRRGIKPYPLDSRKLDKEYSISIGVIMKSKDNMAAINHMIQGRKDDIAAAVVDGWRNRKLSKLGIGLTT
jgi:hypothetical protein